MENNVEFKAWPKTPRPKGNRIVITEKLDGTNGCLVVQGGKLVAVQSRNRFVRVGDDNFGFAHWAYSNAEDILKLGDGYHYGEWVGPGIQKNPHNLAEKAFYLFNTFRPADTLPDCLNNVPVLYEGAYDENEINRVYTELWASAEKADYTPEGIIVLNLLTGQRVKHTYANKDGKWV